MPRSVAGSVICALEANWRASIVVSWPTQVLRRRNDRRSWQSRSGDKLPGNQPVSSRSTLNPACLLGLFRSVDMNAIKTLSLAALLELTGTASATSFVVTTDAVVGAVGATSEASSDVSSSFTDDKIVLAARDDAAAFVASQGDIRGARLEAALQHIRQQVPSLQLFYSVPLHRRKPWWRPAISSCARWIAPSTSPRIQPPRCATRKLYSRRVTMLPVSSPAKGRSAAPSWKPPSAPSAAKCLKIGRASCRERGEISV